MKKVNLKRKVFYVIYLLFLKNTPEDYRPYVFITPKIRNLLVKNYLFRCGKNIRVKGNAEISPSCIVGDNSEIGTRAIIQANCKIGSNVIMGPDVKIYSKNHNYSRIDIPIQKQGEKEGAVTIGDDVWICANVIVTPNTKIGNHCILSAGAVVTKDVPDWSIVAGVPAKIIKKRK